MSDLSFKLIDGISLRPALGVVLLITLVIWGLLAAALIYHWRKSIFKRRALILAETIYILGSLGFIGFATVTLLTL